MELVKTIFTYGYENYFYIGNIFNYIFFNRCFVQFADRQGIAWFAKRMHAQGIYCFQIYLFTFFITVFSLKRVYCSYCVELLIGSGARDAIMKQSPWFCFLCTPFSPESHGLIQPRTNWASEVFYLLNYMTLDHNIHYIDLSVRSCEGSFIAMRLPRLPIIFHANLLVLGLNPLAFLLDHRQRCHLLQLTITQWYIA